MNHNKIVNKIIIINILLVVYFSVEYIFFLADKDFYIKLIEFQLFIVFIFSLVSMYTITKNWLNIYIMFLGMVFLFLLSRPFLHLFDLLPMVNYNEFEWFRIRSNFQFSDYTINKINFVLIYTILFMNLGYLIGILKFKKDDIKVFQFSKFLNKQIGYIFFILGAAAFVYKVLFYIYILKNYGYFAIYSGNFTLPAIVRIFDDFFYVGFMIIISNVPSKKEAYWLSLIFIILYSTIMLGGMRGEFFTFLFAVIYALSFIYNWKVSIIRIIVFGLGLVLLAQYAVYLKFSNTNVELNVFNMINNMFYSQGVTILVLGYVIEFQDYFVDIFSGARYIISPIVSFFYGITGQVGNRYEMPPEIIGALGDKLQYFTDPQGYYMGAGTGSTFVAELYGLGGDIILVSIGVFMLGFFIAYISEKLVYQQYGLFIFLIILPILFWIPRASYIMPLQKMIFAYILLYGFVFVYELFYKKRKV